MTNDWWRGAVIYQIYPRSFQDSNGDGVGDLPGIVRRLDHVASLGVDAVWLSPFFTSPMTDMGYDVSNYKDVDPIFGSLEDFDALVERAHEFGIKVIIDQVLSHTSDHHPWFRESRTSRTNARADWYVWADPKEDGSPPNNWVSVFGGQAWEWNATRRQYFLHNFLVSQPDLNFHNPAVQDAALDVMRFWLERGVDGFRFDTSNFYFHDAELRSNPPAPREKHLPYAVNPYDMQDHVFSKNRPENIAWLKRIRSLMDEFPGTTTVGEIGETLHALELMSQYTEGTDKLHMAYSFDMLLDRFSPQHFRKTVEGFFDAAPNGWPCWSFSNHDVERHVTRWRKHAKNREDLARQMAAMILTLKGTVCLYQGEELGLPEADILFEELTDPPGIRFWPEYKGRDGCRTPIPWDEGEAPNGFSTGRPWLPVKPDHSTLNVAAQNASEASVASFYRRMLAFRHDNPALIDGDTRFLDVEEPLLAYTRSKDGKTLLCVFNLSPDTQKLQIRQNTALHTTAITAGIEHSGAALELTANAFGIFEVQSPQVLLTLLSS